MWLAFANVRENVRPTKRGFSTEGLDGQACVTGMLAWTGVNRGKIGCFDLTQKSPADEAKGEAFPAGGSGV
jgi:hypothetical protein